MREILVTGGSGQVGTHLRHLVWPADMSAYFPTRAEMDLADIASIEAAFTARRFAGVINCAAYTAVDRCEADIVAAWRANALAPAALAIGAASQNIPILHVSTDYVFDGAKSTAYDEGDRIGPIGVYGASKAGGELAVRSSNPRHAIVRTSWVVSPYGNNFVKTMLRLGTERELVRVVDDQWGAPTHAGDLAQALAVIILRMIDNQNAPTGTYHFSNTGSVNWHGVAAEVFHAMSRQGAKTPKLEPITTAQYPLPARRPANSRLSTAKITHDYAIQPRPWQHGIHDIVSQLLDPKNTKD